MKLTINKVYLIVALLFFMQASISCAVMAKRWNITDGLTKAGSFVGIFISLLIGYAVYTFSKNASQVVMNDDEFKGILERIREMDEKEETKDEKN